ncbi:MAG: (d)CMP kinase [Oscillospiraceae bacterium]|nr:(d)CMP kinase [Oscillospiraceae bacterium]
MKSIAIDGPSGAGKSTLAQMTAKKLGFNYVDTGAIYRTVAWFLTMRGADLQQADEVEAALPDAKIEITYDEGGAQHMLLNGEDVSGKIRTPEVSAAASKVAAMACVRAFLLQMQRDVAAAYDVVMDGRDIGTVVLPDAKVKIFLTASDEVRAQRRLAELQAKGEKADFETVLQQMHERDRKDIEREIAPLRCAEDAVILDTTHLSLEQSEEMILVFIEEILKG